MKITAKSSELFTFILQNLEKINFFYAERMLCFILSNHINIKYLFVFRKWCVKFSNWRYFIKNHSKAIQIGG